jgi:succinate dehydrogenase/fumarate reductase flavoprotein subunit
LFTVFEAIARAALERKERYGAQLREDYPSKDEALGQVNIILWKASDGAMEVRCDPITQCRQNFNKSSER